MSRIAVLVLMASVLVAGIASPQGTPLGPEFRVNTFTTGSQDGASVASDPSGNVVVVWSGFAFHPPPISVRYLFGQRYDSSGVPLGAEFRVDTYVYGVPESPRVAFRFLRQLRRRLGGPRSRRSRLWRLRSALRRFGCSPRSRVPRQLLYDGLPRGSHPRFRFGRRLRRRLEQQRAGWLVLWNLRPALCKHGRASRSRVSSQRLYER